MKIVAEHIQQTVSYGTENFITEEKSQNSTEYLNQTTYSVDLSKLYKIHDSCFSTYQLKYCPIIVEKVINVDKKAFYL